MKHNYSIGVLFADESNSGLTHDYFASILDSFKRASEAKGYDISFLNCSLPKENRKTYLEQAEHRKYDGVVIACIDYDNPEVTELINSTIPIVAIDQEMDNVVTVQSDNEQGIKELVRYLAEMGHKRIAYITGDDNVVTAIRLQGFRETCAELGIDIPEEYIRQSEYRNMKKATYQTEQLLRLPNPPSCILYSDDFAAIGGINILRARGLEIPEDISVAGYDGINILSQYQPRLTTVRQNTVEIGRIAAERLIECIENPDDAKYDTVTVETELERGRTVGRVFF
ncbi:MAG: LacI family DNA-binding transcriptional regulator [Lachnospiraceae bacterium]